jgi:hypothetical protein
MSSEIPCSFNQKRSLTICAKWDTSQNQSGADDAADRRALAGESGRLDELPDCFPSLGQEKIQAGLEFTVRLLRIYDD